MLSQIDVIKTLYYNFKLFGFSDALRLPLIIGKCTRIQLKRGDVSIKTKARFGLITFGIGGSPDLYSFDSHKSYLGVNGDGKIVFHGKAHFAIHTSCLASGGTIIFGDGFSSNVGCKFSSKELIEFGSGCLIGGNVVIRDSDGHRVYSILESGDKEYHESTRSIKIGQHVWVGNAVSILKGVTIGDGCIVAYGALVIKSLFEKNCLVGGVPCSVLKHNISWER